MNNLDLDAYGVVEITKEELQETNGGSVFAYLIGLGVGFLLARVIFSSTHGEVFEVTK